LTELTPIGHSDAKLCAAMGLEPKGGAELDDAAAEERAGLPRREFLRRGAITGGALAGLGALPVLVREAYGDPIPVPPGARSVEAGLTAFVTRWEAAGPAVRLTRFGPFLSDKIFNCRVAGTPRSYILRLGTAGATLNPGIDPFRHVDVVMPEKDWLGVLYGDYTGLAPFVGGSMFPPRDGANKAVLLGIVMYVTAFIPVGSKPDPDLLLRVLQGLAIRGLPQCAGEPDTFEEATRLQQNPEKELSEVALPPASAPPVTRTLARFVANLRYEDLPPGAVKSAKEQLKSILAAMFAGSRMPPAKKFARGVKGFGDRHEATVIGEHCFRTSARHAALLNSVYAQVLEWEDWTFLSHSGACIVPTALATGELTGASGKELVTAIVAGNEILARSGEVLTDVIHTGNALPTHQIETPLVAGKLLGLSAGRLQDAVGICCTQPQVTAIPAWTADAKGLLTGWPVMTGVEAAQYAKAGVTGRRDILESPGGYCYRVSEIANPTRLQLMIDGLGKTWRFAAERNELFTKRFPTDGFQLTSVQAILDIVNKKAKKVFDATPRSQLPKLVKRVEVRIPWVMAASATMFSKDHSEDMYRRIRDEPDWTYITLLFDGTYPVAASLVFRRLTFREYSDKAIFDPVVQAMINKVDLVPDITQGVFGATALVELTDGRKFESAQGCIEDFPVEEKLRIGAGGVRSRRQIDAIVRAVDRIERFDDVRDFVEVCCGHSTRTPARGGSGGGLRHRGGAGDRGGTTGTGGGGGRRL
jgi:2-methylcitrate dehydratase PrpD